MKQFLSLFAVVLFSFCAFGQVNFVNVASNLGNRSTTIQDAGGVGNYEILYVPNASGQLVQIYKNSEDSLWNQISTNVVPYTDLDNYSTVVPFMYQGKKTIAYKHGANLIEIAQWDGISGQYVSILPTFTTPNMGSQFDVGVNPITGEIYLATVYAITTGYINISHFELDSMSWTDDLYQYAPVGSTYNLTDPQICFKSDTMYIGTRDVFFPNDSVMVFKQKYDMLSDTLYPVLFSDTNLVNATSYSLKTNAAQDLFLATFNKSNSTAYLSKLQGGVVNPIASKTYSGVASGLVDLFYNTSDLPMMSVSTGDASTFSQTEILETSGALLQSASGGFFGQISGTAISLADVSGVQSNSGHYVVNISTGINSFTSTEAYASNTMPTVTSIDFDDSICYVPGADFNYTTVVNNITFNDADNDKVFIVDAYPVNNSGTILQQGSFNIQQIQRTGGITAYRMVSVNVWDSGTTDLAIVYSDGFESDTVVISTIHSLVGANPPPSLVNDAGSITPVFCANTSLIDFTQVTGNNPGVFKADGEEFANGMYPVSEYTGSEMFTFSYLDVASGCYSELALISPTALTPPTASVTATATACDTNNGTVSLAYTTPGANLKDIYWSAGFHDSTSLSHLYAGQNLVTVTDSNDCIATAAANVGINGLTISENIMNEVCAGDKNGSISLTVSGSDAPYTYLWSNGKSTSGISNLGSGTYQVVITSASGCKATKSYTITQPLGPVVINDFSPFPPDCGSNNGQLDASPTGGLTPYTFQWNTGDNTQQIFGLYAGIYHVKVTDALGCSAEKDVILNDYATPNVFATEVAQPSCGLSNGYIAAELTNMSVFASVSWNNGATTMFNGNLAPGTYTCEATTLNGCHVYKSWELKADRPMKNNICMLTVDSATNTNLIVWEKVQNNMDHYNIYREGSVAGQFELIDTVSGLNYSVFNDVVASPRVHSWRYRISAVNQCGVEGPLSDVHKTIHIVISQSIGNQYNISWDEYEGFDYSTVKLWRYTNATDWVLVDSLPSNIFSYTDNVTGSTAGLDYMIEIQPPAPCSVDKAQNYNSSRSNKANGLMVPGSGTGASNNGIDEYSNNALPIAMYPNPTTGMLTIVNETGQKTNVKLTSSAGKLISSFSYTDKIQKNFGNLEAGIYFLHFESKGKAKVKKLIIH